MPAITSFWWVAFRHSARAPRTRSASVAVDTHRSRVGVMPFSSEEGLIALANATEYGLAAGIWTQDISRAMRFARDVDAGTVWINTYRSAAYMSANGGMKHSGY